MELTISIKGRLKNSDLNNGPRSKVENFPNGEGLYLVVDESDVPLSLINVCDANKDGYYYASEIYFSPADIISITLIEERPSIEEFVKSIEKSITEHVTKVIIDEVISAVKGESEVILNTLDGFENQHSCGVSEKTLLSALEIACKKNQ